MIKRIAIILLYVAFIYSCNRQAQSSEHEEDTISEHKHENANNENHEHDDHRHDTEGKISIIQYTDDFELFAEADPFLIDSTSTILAHFTHLEDFTPLENATVTVVLNINGKEDKQILKTHTRKGIYSFDITPNTVGKGKLSFIIKDKESEYKITVEKMTVYGTAEGVFHELEKSEQPEEGPNTVNFTKEQSWDIEFETMLPIEGNFGQVIKTVGQIQSGQGDEELITAKTNGIVTFNRKSIFEGQKVFKGQTLLTINEGGISENNASVKFQQAQNDFIKAESEYKRAKELAKDKIVSEKQLEEIKNSFENAKVVYENLSRNFGKYGQNIRSSKNGFVKHIYVKNGEYVESGQAIFNISENKNLLIKADVQPKYMNELSKVKSGNIKIMNQNKTYTFDELKGEVVSYGKSTNLENYQIPVTVQIQNKLDFIPGSFVELYLKTEGNNNTLTVPTSSLLEEQGSYFVYVQLNPELFKKRLVKIGFSDGLNTEIIKGLSNDERIVSKGAIFLKLSKRAGTLDAHSGHVH